VNVNHYPAFTNNGDMFAIGNLTDSGTHVAVGRGLDDEDFRVVGKYSIIVRNAQSKQIPKAKKIVPRPREGVVPLYDVYGPAESAEIG
jgi:hypothetical protein